MARGVNKVILIGNLGKDPEMRYFPSGDAVCNVSLATSESWNDKQTNEKKEHTEWHNLVFRKKLAEIVAQYCKKGAKIYVEGSIRSRKYQDKEGKERYITEIWVNDMQMLDGKAGTGAMAGGGERNGGYEKPAPTGRGAAPAPAASPSEEPFEDDDIPF